MTSHANTRIGVESSTSALRHLHSQFMSEQRYATRLAPKTLEAYKTSFDLFVLLMPTVGLPQVTAAAITEFFRRLDTRTRRQGRYERRGVSPSTIASHRSRLGRFFAWLQARGAIESNPFSLMPYPRVTYEGRQYLAKAEVERIFAVLALAATSRTRFHRRRNLALFATLLYTGVRRGELLGLKLADLNLERHELAVRAATSKSRHGRIVPMNAALLTVLEDYLVERRKIPLLSDRLFVSEGGHALTLDGLKHLVREMVRRSGVRFHLHQFRHTFAVNFLNRVGDIAKLKQLLGHRDIRMTSGYLRALPAASMRDGVESLSLDALL